MATPDNGHALTPKDLKVSVVAGVTDKLSRETDELGWTIFLVGEAQSNNDALSPDNVAVSQPQIKPAVRFLNTGHPARIKIWNRIALEPLTVADEPLKRQRLASRYRHVFIEFLD